ncbi:MAG: glycosyltransferase [Cyclobacteriaceae bacterium]|nr:glycosyltransferase [Cyclobacteriaceae bacterium]
MVELSIILPVYNVALYLERCIRSLEDQDLDSSRYEIIVVNDGSPDNSREVVIQLQHEFKNLILIDQENKGVSLARNAGMDRAQGNYLLFVDPDDFILPHTLSDALACAIERNAHVAFLGYQFRDVDGNLVQEVLNPEQVGSLYAGVDAYPLSRGDGTLDPDRSVAVLYHRDFMNENHLRYISDIPYLEDGEFLARVLCLAQRCIFAGKSFYVRTTRPGSATNSSLFFSNRAIEGFVRAAINLKKFQTQLDNNRQIVFLNQPIVKFTLLSFQAFISKSFFFNLRNILRIKKRLKRAGMSILSLEGCSSLYFYYGALYNRSLLFFYAAWMTRLAKERIRSKN